MNFSSAADLCLKTFLGDEFRIQFSQEYGSHNSHHRRLIRNDIITQFGQKWSTSEKENFSDLSQIPRMEKGFVSISHTVDCGVWIVGPRSVGVDIEQLSRISEKLVRRVCDESEIFSTQTQVGSYQALWTAKESAFKALSFVEPVSVLSEIEIFWGQIGDLSQGETFQVSHKQTNKKKSCKGLAILTDFHAFSVTILNH